MFFNVNSSDMLSEKVNFKKHENEKSVCTKYS